MFAHGVTQSEDIVAAASSEPEANERGSSLIDRAGCSKPD